MSKKKTKSVMATGKRKTSIARVTIKPGKGAVRINSRNLNVFEPELARLKIKEPLMLAGDVVKTMDINANVYGGGYLSQADAVRVAMAKAIVIFTKSKDIKKKFLDYDRYMLVSDTRRTEPQKPYRSSARSKRQKSKR
jgi:small subunit ribosomal protein S9